MKRLGPAGPSDCAGDASIQLPNRAEINSAIVRCYTPVVPLRTVNGKLNGGVCVPKCLTPIG
jgi:hypothetical protein